MNHLYTLLQCIPLYSILCIGIALAHATHCISSPSTMPTATDIPMQSIETIVTQLRKNIANSTERTLIQRLLENEKHYLAVKARAGSVGPNLDPADKAFIAQGYQQQKQSLFNALAAEQPNLVPYTTQLIEALQKHAITLRTMKPGFVGGLHPHVGDLYENTIASLVNK